MKNVYPKIFKSKLDGTIVEFIALMKGVVLVKGDEYSDNVGVFDDNWAPNSNSEVWVELSEDEYDSNINEYINLMLLTAEKYPEDTLDIN
jgi:hypothetical protein